jgi:hypothetical protein
MEEYNSMEIMISVASRFLEDGATISVGTGGPCAAAMLAQKLHSPNLLIIFEAGDCTFASLNANFCRRFSYNV